MKKSSSKIAREVDQILRKKVTGVLGTRVPPSGSSLLYRSIGGEGDPWPAWLREHRSSCGVYAIKHSGNVVYVGSSRKRLYATVTRHFQRWHRKKNFWKGLHGAGHDPGLTYVRGRCEVAIKIVACGSELEEEARLIDRLRPRDNLTEHPDGRDGLEDAPF